MEVQSITGTTPMPAARPGSMWFVGCGNMAGAMVEGWRLAGLDFSSSVAIRPSGTPVEGLRTVRSLFEAARWAASSYNEQPWSYIVATRADPGAFGRLLSCLVDANQAWARAAPVLAIGCTSLNFALNGKPNAAAIHDLGLAGASLTLEATARGLCVHQMIGILPDRARELYRVPDGVQPLTGAALPDHRTRLVEEVLQRQFRPGQRRDRAQERPGRRQLVTDLPDLVQGEQE